VWPNSCNALVPTAYQRPLMIYIQPMTPLISGFLTLVAAFSRSHYRLGLEIVALRQQLGVL
jgi:hypothetical protein